MPQTPWLENVKCGIHTDTATDRDTHTATDRDTHSHTLCKLGQHCQSPTVNSAAMHNNIYDMGMKEPNRNLSQPPILI